MNAISRYWLICVMGLIWGPICHAEALKNQAGPEVLPIEVFFSTASVSQPRLSDDGKRVAFLVREETGLNAIATLDLSTMKGSVVFRPNDFAVSYLFWKGDRIVFGGDAGGNESFSMRSIQYDGRDLKDLSESYQEFRALEGPVGASLESRLKRDPTHVLVLGYGSIQNSQMIWEASGEFGFYKLNIRDKRRDFVEAYDHRAIEYFTDGALGEVFGRTRQSGQELIIELKKGGTGSYVEVARHRVSEKPYEFLGMSPDHRVAFVFLRGVEGVDRNSLYAFDLQTMKLGQPIYVPAAGELVNIHRDEQGNLVGVAIETDTVEHVFFSKEWATMYAALKASFPGKKFSLTQSVLGSRLNLVRTYSDRDPGSYFIFDSTKPALYPLGKIYPKVDPSKMSFCKPVAYPSRDGLEIHGYLTEPLGREGKKNPFIVLPHGGPFGIRDSWGYDSEAQFLANRGYSVLQMNYRGSGGYGYKFEAAGMKRWGREMQDDITDGVQWAIKQGLADPERVAIYGASYGGYATLAGLVYTPELYRCGVNYVGVTDLRMQVQPRQGNPRFFSLWAPMWIGSDSDDLKARSPVEFVERIQVPTLHAYGENDPRVDISQWTALERQLKKHNKPYIFFRESGEGHGFKNENKRIRFYRAMESFLEENMRPDKATVKTGPTEVVEMPATLKK